MRFEGLDLNLLVAFDALMHEGSVTRAAKRLNVTQPALSAAIARLRDYFSDPLFVMEGRRLTPTALSRSLAEPARDILVRIRSNLIARPQFDPAHSQRHFRIVVSDYANIVLMHDVLRKVYAEAPGVTFELLPLDDNPDERLAQAEVDFLIYPENSLSRSYPRQFLFADEYCCLVAKDNRSVGRAISRREYLDLGHVTAAFGPARRISFEERYLAQRGIHRRIEVVAQDFSSMAALVAGTGRIATMHARLARHFVRLLPLRILKTPVAIPGFRESLQWPSALDGDPAMQWLRGHIGTAAARLSNTVKR